MLNYKLHWFLYLAAIVFKMVLFKHLVFIITLITATFATLMHLKPFINQFENKKFHVFVSSKSAWVQRYPRLSGGMLKKRISKFFIFDDLGKETDNSVRIILWTLGSKIDLFDKIANTTCIKNPCWIFYLGTSFDSLNQFISNIGQG